MYICNEWYHKSFEHIPIMQYFGIQIKTGNALCLLKDELDRHAASRDTHVYVQFMGQWCVCQFTDQLILLVLLTAQITVCHA